jgi:hypothetical protein
MDRKPIANQLNVILNEKGEKGVITAQQKMTHAASGRQIKF